MKKYVTIGLGNFGFNLSNSLEKNGCEVLGIDTSREVVDRAKDFVSHAVIGDASNRDVLESLMLKDFDGAIVSLGQDMASSILIALYLIEIGVKKIIVRAISEDHGKILEKIGVHEVIFPEKDIAERIADQLSLVNAMDYLPLGHDYGIVEVKAPGSFVGKTLKELQITAKYQSQIVGILTGEEMKMPPAADDEIHKSSVLTILGKFENIAKIKDLS